MERYNPWWVGDQDEIYETWLERDVRWIPDIINKISLKPYALHFLVGPRQVGKTTALKIFIHNLIERGTNPKSIFYYSCDEIIDFRDLGEILDTYLSSRRHWNIRSSIIVLDEITYVEDWWRALKSRIDQGVFKKDIIVVSGSVGIAVSYTHLTLPTN